MREESERRVKKRRPWVAGALSFLQPGLGHLHAGNPGAAILLYVCALLGLVLFGLVVVLSPIPEPFHVVTGIAVPIAVYLYAVTSSVRLARRQPADYRLRWYNRWYVYVLILLVVSLIPDTDIIKQFSFQAYKMAAGSMSPTIAKGDHVLVNRLAYGLQAPGDCRIDEDWLSWTCYTSTPLIEVGQPRFGDVIVFRYPEDEDKLFIKRIAGLPGDTIEIRDKVLHVNGQPVEDAAYTRRIDAKVYERSVNARDNFGPVVVPEEAYFTLGDNRDQSFDSRFWGFLRRDKIVGKVATIYWSFDETPRWERIGRRIHHLSE